TWHRQLLCNPHEPRVILGSQNPIREALADDIAKHFHKPHQVIGLAVIEPKSLFIDVPLQMEGGTPDVGAANRSFEQAEIVLHPVDVYAVANVPRQMVNPVVVIVHIQPDVRWAGVSIDAAPP